MDTRVALQPAYVLHTRPFQNTSLLVDFFTLDYGRVRAVAKGARREKSRYRSLLQLFQPLLMSYSGRSEVKTLTNLDCNLAPIQLQGNRMFSGLYMNELLTRLLHNQEEHRDLYRAYQEALVRLQSDADLETLLREFELRLLAELGYAINLEEDCRSHEPIREDQDYSFTPDVGFQSSSAQDSVIKAEDLYPGAHLLALRQLDLAEPAIAKTAKRLLRTALLAHLGEKPLYSRSLFG